MPDQPRRLHQQYRSRTDHIRAQVAAGHPLTDSDQALYRRMQEADRRAADHAAARPQRAEDDVDGAQ